MDNKKWDEVYTSENVAWGKFTSTFLKEVIHMFPEGCKVLDLGCGNGRNLHYLINNGYDAVGYEFSNIAISQAVTKNIYYKDLVKDEWDIGKFDVVIDFGFYHFYPTNKQHEYFTKLDSVLKVLFLGRIEGLKGAKEIIEAICKLNAQNKLKYFEFNFVGHENELGYIEDLKYILKEKNIEGSKVKFKGRITGRQKFKEFASNDIYLFPSYTEGCPTSVLEALASGLFCITTPVGALEEIVIPNINGLHIKIKSVDDIVDALLLCKANKMLLNRRHEISKEAITKFEITHLCKKFNLFYNKIYS